MARIRSLKIGFFKNEELAALPYEARLLFEGLWLLADREGRLEDRPRRIKAEVFPYDVIDVEPLLAALHDARFILRYAADGAAYIQVLTFWRHQRPKNDEAVSVIPAPPLENPRGKDDGPRISPRGKDRETERQRDRETEDRETEDREGLVGGADAAPLAADGAALRTDADGAEAHGPEDFAALWNATTQMPIPRCRELSSKRRRHVRARLTERVLADWAAVFQRIQNSPFCRGENDRGWVASFDWVVGSPDVAVKVLEGHYDDRRKTPRSGERPFTTQELADAKRVRANWFGQCRHEPACESANACLAAIIRQWRRERGEAA
jgi:hypothetical protein